MFNFLSLLSFANAVFLMFLSVYSILVNRKSPINQSSSLECLLLALWSFSYTFFYIAPNKEAAWFWLKLGSIGWSAFMGVLVWFFIAVTRYQEKMNRILKVSVIVIVPAVLVLLNLFSPITSAAVDIKLSSRGMGWTYINSVSNGLYWAYVAYLAVGAFLSGKILKTKINTGQSKHFRRLVLAFLILDGLIVAGGFLLDLVIPLITDAIPPLTNVFLIVFSFGYWFIIAQYEVFQKTSLEASEYVLNTISDALMVLDRQGNILHCNKATSDLLQYDMQEIVGNRLIKFFKKDSFDPERIKELYSEKKLVNKDADLMAKDGSVIHSLFSASVVENDTYGFMGTIISFHDITKQKKLERELYELANYDPLTGLPNRRFFLEVLHRFEASYQNDGKDFAIFFMDLNGFKKINDVMGHDKGDQLLIEIGKRIGSSIDGDDLIARMGGDEFVMLLADVRDESQIRSRKERIKGIFEKKIVIDGILYPVGVSIGCARYSEAGGISALLREADQRMYAHKTEFRMEAGKAIL